MAADLLNLTIGRRAVKVLLYVLLSVNAVYYSVTGTLAEAIDSMAWLALLFLFDAETARGVTADAASPWIRVSRMIAGAAIAAAIIGYTRDEAWLDVANTLLWIAVIVMLELEVRHRATVADHRVLLASVATLLYSGLGVLVLIWAWQDAWLDAYDALLWLAAFVIIEMRLLEAAHRSTAS